MGAGCLPQQLLAGPERRATVDAVHRRTGRSQAGRSRRIVPLSEVATSTVISLRSCRAGFQSRNRIPLRAQSIDPTTRSKSEGKTSKTLPFGLVEKLRDGDVERVLQLDRWWGETSPALHFFTSRRTGSGKGALHIKALQSHLFEDSIERLELPARGVEVWRKAEIPLTY